MSWAKAVPTAIGEGFQKAVDVISGRAKQEAFLEKLGRMAEFTPDVGKLEKKMRWLLFVPDECMQSHPDHARLGNVAKGIGEAFTVDTFTLWKERQKFMSTAIPLRYQYGEEALIMSPRYAIRYPIRGELYFVNAQSLIKLDHHRENGVRFVRERVQVRRPFTQIQLKKKPLAIEGSATTVNTFVKEETRLLGEPLDVWMYVGHPEYWEEHLTDSHVLVRRFKPHNPLLSTYYHFSPEEHEQR